MHEDQVTKSKRITNSLGKEVSTIELDPWGADTNRSKNIAFRPKKFTTYERDSNGTDEAMFRRYNRWHSRFDQPDPYGGSTSLTNPQSFNRYAYVQGDPVNFVDPSGLMPCRPGNYSAECDSSGFGGWGGGWNFNDRGHPGREIIYDAEYEHDYRYYAENGPFRFHSAFIGFQWFGFFPQKPGRQEKEKTTDRKLEECVLAALGHYLKADAITLLKQAGVQAGIGLGAGFALFFGAEAVAGSTVTESFVEIGLEGFGKLDALGRAGAFGVASVATAALLDKARKRIIS
jgi:RHS repeat-associated protein